MKAEAAESAWEGAGAKAGPQIPGLGVTSRSEPHLGTRSKALPTLPGSVALRQVLLRCDQGLFGIEIQGVGTGKQALLHSEPYFLLLAPSIAKDQNPTAVCEGQVQRQQVSLHLGINVRDQGCALERKKGHDGGPLQSQV